MAKRRRKQIKCLNCGTSLQEPYNYCPNCGQENNDNNISFGMLYKDFWSNYFSIDSRFGRTIKPFFTKPGEITLDFIEGKRVKYANPVRLYLLISFIHFFFFFKYSADRDNLPAVVQFNSGSDSASVAIADSLAVISDAKNGAGFTLSAKQFMKLVHMNKEGNYTVEEIYDSLEIPSTVSWIDKRLTRQLIKINRLSNVELNLYIFRQIPIGMFFILPVIALLFKLFYQKRLYILHVIHALHLHSFVLLILSFNWFALWFWHFESAGLLLSSTFLGIVYSYFSFKKVYAQGWWKTALKFISTGFLYLIVLMISVVLLTVVALFFY